MTRTDVPTVSAAKRLSVTIAAVALVASGAPALAGIQAGPAGEPTSCGDAADPCTLTAEGEKDRLVRGVNDVDHYELSPPADASILAVELDVTDSVGVATILSLSLVDPTGVVRDEAFGDQTLRVETVGAPAGTWHLEVAYHDPALLQLPPWGTDTAVPFPHGDATTDYRLNLDLEPVDHVAPVHAEGSPAPTLQFEAGQQTTRLDLYYDTRTHVPTPSSWGAVVMIREETIDTEGNVDASTVSSTSLYSRVPFSNAEVWTHGATPSELGTVEVDPQAVHSERIQQYRVTVSTSPDELRQARTSLGIAYSGGLDGVEGWLAWNGTSSGQGAASAEASRPTVSFDNGVATFAATDDFREDDSGTAVRAGPASVARNLTIDHEVPEEMADSILVRATNIANHPPAPVFEVQRPDGQNRTLEGEIGQWTLDDPPEGTWNITMQEREGAEYGQMWVGAASFPLLDLRFGHGE